MHRIQGHHHTSMIVKYANETNYFYETVLGFRRVKVTVNQDDPSMYHLFYGDKTGSPGTELTFFEMPLVGNTYKGTNAITRIGLLVPSEASLSYWENRFAEYDVVYEARTIYANRKALHFEDIDGLQLVLVVAEDIKPKGWEPWESSPVPIHNQIMGMGPVEMTVRRQDKLARTLTELFGYKEAYSTEQEVIYQSKAGEPFGEIVVRQQEGPREKPGRGSIHHLAIRAKDDAELHYWDERVKERGFRTTGIVDRYYFKSLYFRESNGIMFEIATDGPGFTVDSDVNSLGETLDLPPKFAGRRMEIEANLSSLD